MVVRIIDNDPSQHSEACASLESVFKDLGEFPTAIKVKLFYIGPEELLFDAPFAALQISVN